VDTERRGRWGSPLESGDTLTLGIPYASKSDMETDLLRKSKARKNKQGIPLTEEGGRVYQKQNVEIKYSKKRESEAGMMALSELGSPLEGLGAFSQGGCVNEDGA